LKKRFGFKSIKTRIRSAVYNIINIIELYMYNIIIIMLWCRYDDNNWVRRRRRRYCVLLDKKKEYIKFRARSLSRDILVAMIFVGVVCRSSLPDV